MRGIFLPALLALVACGTPQERCISAASKDIRVLDRLISASRSNIERGYAFERKPYYYTVRQVCGEVDGEKLYCNVPETGYRSVPVSIDLNVEQAKLNSQLAKRSQLATEISRKITACKTAYPAD